MTCQLSTFWADRPFDNCTCLAAHSVTGQKQTTPTARPSSILTHKLRNTSLLTTLRPKQQPEKMTLEVADKSPAKGTYDSYIAYHNALDSLLTAYKNEWLITDEVVECEWLQRESFLPSFLTD